jgi:hypothetical protein
MTRPIGSETVLLAEVPEAVAVGSLAGVYADIRSVLGVANVVLVYRALAAQPGRLEGLWSALRPNLASAQARTLVAGLSPRAVGGVAPGPAAAVERAALDQRLVLGTLCSFQRSNRLNLIGLLALLHGAAGTGETPAPPRRWCHCQSSQSPTWPRTQPAQLRCSRRSADRSSAGSGRS